MARKLTKIKKQERKLQKIFYNTQGQKGAYSSNPKIIKGVYDELYPDDNITLKRVHQYLKNQYTYQRHRNYI